MMVRMKEDGRYGREKRERVLGEASSYFGVGCDQTDENELAWSECQSRAGVLLSWRWQGDQPALTAPLDDDMPEKRRTKVPAMSANRTPLPPIADVMPDAHLR